MAPLADDQFNEVQSAKVQTLLHERMETMPPEDFSEMLRTAIVEDEWMLILLGAVLGFFAGVAQVAFLF